MKKKQSPKSTELSLLQLNFHSNVYVAPTVALGIRYSNSAVSLPGVWCFVRGLRCSISGFGEEFKSSGVDGGRGGAQRPGNKLFRAPSFLVPAAS